MTDVLRRVETVNVGLSTFADALRAQGAPVVEVDWRPPAGGDPRALELLTRLWGRHGDRIAAGQRGGGCAHRGRGAARADRRAGGRGGARPAATGCCCTRGRRSSGRRVCDPQRRALLAAAVFEGWAPDRTEAERLLERGEIALEPGNEHDHVGPMTGVCSPSMPVWVVEDERFGERAFSTLNEGPGHTLWFGVGDDESVDRLRFFRDTLGPGAGAPARAQRPDRRLRARRPGPQHGRRAAHAQPGDRQPAHPRAGARRWRPSAARRPRASSPAITTSS